MKWTITILIALGIVAALFSAILVSTMRRDTSGERDLSKEISAVLMAKPLPAMSVITSGHIKKDTVPKDKLPAGYISSPVQAIGRVLAVPVVEGQALTQSCFVTEGTGAQLAAALPHGMRAVTVSVSDNTYAEGLLYPGCLVDVLASFKLQSGKLTKGESLSTTLLRGIEVLAIENLSVISQQAKQSEKSAVGISQSKGNRLRITLLVNSKQAEALQLATTNGSISLAIRNPLDKKAVAIGSTILSQERLAKSGSLLAPTILSGSEEVVAAGEAGAQELEDANATAKLAKASYIGEEAEKKVSPQWEMTVIRGSEVKEEVLDISNSPAAAGKTE